jgi:hypothetical protein
LKAQNAVMGMTQLPKEDVRDFAARMQVAATTLYPPAPSELKVVIIENTHALVIPNPIKAVELAKYHVQEKVAENILLRYFMAGLRPEIRNALQTDIYEEYKACVEAARKAEWMTTSIGAFGGARQHMYAIEEAQAIEAVPSPAAEPSRGQPKETRSCYNCGQQGHLIANCRKPAANKGFISSGNRSGSFRGSFRGFRPLGSFGTRGGRGRQRGQPGRGGARSFGRQPLPTRLQSFLRTPPFQQLPRDPRNKGTRNWMVRARARQHLRRRYEKQNCLEAGEPEEEETYPTGDDEVLYNLEFQYDDDELQDYAADVEYEVQKLEADAESYNADAKNW